MADSRGKPSGKGTRDPSITTGSGRVGMNDRGNMTWEWADDEDLLADDEFGAAERIRALVDPALTIQEDDLAGNGPVQSNPKGLKKGYNPYNSGTLDKQEWKKKKDLRELSKWIELRKKVQDRGPGGVPEDSDEEA
jgi:hypothetical protein